MVAITAVFKVRVVSLGLTEGLNVIMRMKHRHISYLFTCVGFAIAFLAGRTLLNGQNHVLLARTSLVFGIITIIIGFCCYVRSKGYHPAWGLSLLIIGPCAFLIFFLLPERKEFIKLL